MSASDDENGDLRNQGPAASPCDLPDDMRSSHWFRSELLRNANTGLYQYYRIPDFSTPSKVAALCASVLETSVDSRKLKLGAVGPPPSTCIAQVNDIWTAVNLNPPLTPVETESCLTKFKPEPLYASDLALADFGAPGSRHATLLDVAMPSLDDDYIIQDPAQRFDYYPYAPTAIAASDDGLGGIGSLPPGLASAVAIISGGCASTRLHFEDAWLGSSNLLLAGASKIWYIVADHHRGMFLDSLPRHAKHAPGSKSFLPPQPSSADIAAGKIARIVQHPGELVITQPYIQGQTLHWTISCGANICESSNFYLPIAADGTDFAINGTDFDTNSSRCINALSNCHGNARSGAIRTYLADRAYNANILRAEMGLQKVEL